MADLTYTNFSHGLSTAVYNWPTAAGQTYRVLLATTSYVPDQDNHIFVSSVTNELSGGGYVRKDITNRTASKDNANNRTDWLADCPTWTAITGTWRWAVVYKLVTNDADSLLIRAIDLTAVTSSGGDYLLRWDGQTSNGAVIRVAV
jgi:hypothetical protein